MTVREIAWASDVLDSRLRVPHFVRRSMLALEDVAAVANAMAANLASCFESRVAVTIVPPVELVVGDWERLCEGRRCYNVAGEMRDAILVVDERTARRVVATAFGEETADDSLSPFESRVLEHCIAQLAGSLHSLCGDARVSAEGVNGSPSVYFELRLGPPADATLGIAVGARQQVTERTFLHADILEECPIECWVRLGEGNVDIFTFAGLAVGDIVPLETKVGAFATLNLGAETIAAGEGGIVGDRTAFKVHYTTFA